MSTSELSDATPSDATIEKQLRRTTRKIYASKNLENLTVKRIRAATEQSLGLDDGFLKGDKWKQRSKALIEAEVADRDEVAENPQKTTSRRPLDRFTRTPSATKRVDTEELNPSKRRKLGRENDEVFPTIRFAGRGNKTTTIESDDGSWKAATGLAQPDDDVNRSAKGGSPKLKQKPCTDNNDESELSSVIDESPKLNMKKKATNVGAKKKSTSKKVRSKADKSLHLDPDDEEIRRLKNWLLKCGIRKMWVRELQSCDTAQAKIRHLKQMLSEAGMTGRYSTEKASQIRELRELRADLEAVQAGARQWGKTDEGDGEDEVTRPRRKVVRGLEGLDFLDDDDGENSS